MKNNIKEKISIIFVIILMILSTLLACNVLAEEIGEVIYGKMIVRSEHTRTYPDGSYIGYEDLNSYYDVFCCQKGTALPSEPQTHFTANGVDYSFPHLTQNDLHKKIGEVTTTGSAPFDASYTHRTIGLYKIESTNRATPEEAYILSEMIRVDGMGEYNPCQIAWWNTEAGSEGNSVSPNALSLEAQAFEAYIKEVSGITKAGRLVESDCKYKTAKFTDIETGEQMEIENAFDFEYKPEWITDGECAKPTVMEDEETDTYTIGPFALKYAGTTANYGDREQVQFAGITGMDIYTDASDEPLVLGTDWEIICAETVRANDVDYEFPKSGEKFYIKLNYIDGATKIENIKTHFRYMNAAGMYQKLQGKYFEATWTRDSKDNKNDDGEVESTTYWLELTSLVGTDGNSQKLALGLNGARWYEYMDIDRSINIKSKSIKIVKEVKDSDGNKIDTKDFFDFKINVSGAINSGNDKVRVRGNSTVTTKTYYWLDTDPAPTYDIQEIPREGYELSSIENNTGTLESKESIVVKAINTPDENKGRIEIIKKIQNTEYDTSKYSLIGKKFKFELTVSGTFKYDGKMYTEESFTFPELIEVEAVGENDPEKPWISNDFIWYGEDAPNFVVKEVDIPEGAELVSIIPSAGVLIKDETVKVVALNKQEIVGGSLEVIKILENSEYLTEDELKTKEFKFTVHVDGYEDSEIVANKLSREIIDGEYKWVYKGENAPYYKWTYGNEPNYTITEHDNPPETTFVTAYADGTTLSGQTLSGTLKTDETQTFTVLNTFINKVNPKNGNLELTKKIEDPNDPKVLQNRDYLFVVTLSGKFRIEGEAEDVLLRDRTVQFTNDAHVEIANNEYDPNSFVVIHIGENNMASWASKSIEWYGENAPTYKVEENLAGSYGEHIKGHTIVPSSGNLVNSQTVKVIATNYAKEKVYGQLKIIKTLENAEKYDPEYIASIKFNFRITVDGYDPYEVSLEGDRLDDKYVWVYESDIYAWEKDAPAPNYTIEEINLPEGTEFVSAKGLENSTVSGMKVSGTLIPFENKEEPITTDNSFINKLKESTGSISIKKDVTHETLNGVDFKFNLTLKGTFIYNGEEIVNGEKTYENISVAGGSIWNSGEIRWYGDNAPEYSITELESDKAEITNIVNASGKVSKGGTPATFATFTNKPIEKVGRLKIHKTIKDQPINENDKFTFRITVDGYEPYEVSIGADETYISQEYKWFATEEAPKYKVEEVNLPKGTKLVELQNAEGVISDGEPVTVEAINRYDEHRGKFILRKEIVEDKTNPATPPTFEFDITVTGQFTFPGQESTISEIWTEHTSITGEGTYESPEFIWYGDEAPVVNVTEKDISQDGEGWILEGISNNNVALSEDETIEITVTNRYEPLVIIDLTFKMAGTVWNDRPLTNDKNMEGSTPNGKLDQGEIGVDGVEVYIYNTETGELATIYSDRSKNEIQQPIITANGGKWEAPRVPVPKTGSYDVRFMYDGQTYEPTKPLVTGSAEDFRAGSNTGTSGRAKYLNDSMAVDVNRDEVNARLTEIKGNSPIDGSGNTVGTAVGANGEATILYEKSSGENENRTTSKVITINRKDGRVIDLYKAEARTSAVGLTYPFDKKMHLEDFDIVPSELGPAYRYVYSATYPYTLHINLGLVTRELADMDAVKDLVEAKVTVNERLLTYKFNKLADVGKDVLSRESYINGTDGNNNIQYQLGFYKTDYYYRAEMYKASEVYDYMDTFYKSIGQTLDASNLEVYLKYKISVYNESPTYSATINEIADYFDSSFGAPITTEVKKYVQTIDGKETDSSDLETVARSSYIDSTGAEVTWNVTEKGIRGSDGITYNKMTTDALKGMKLASGEKADIFVYFKVQPTSVDGINNTIELANKSNIVEITNYSTFNKDGSIAGKIDTDSAPGNINVEQYNEKAYYEDDTDPAPILELKLDTENAIRTVRGYAWEDKSEENEDNTATGNGIYDEGEEALIGGLTTELVEKIKVPSEAGYTEYDFVWPTNQNLACLGGRTFEELTGFDSTTETARTPGEGERNGVGSYEFTGVPVGNYVVRFIYGNDKSKLNDTFGVTGDPVALKSDGSKFAEGEGNANILVANYDNDIYGKTSAIYNGQDFKSTLYQTKNNEDKTEWHNLKEYENYNTDSDFMDSEARRLETMANSREITNVNGTILATANTYDSLADNDPENYKPSSNHAKLYADTYMMADTSKINFNLEKIDINSENSAMKNFEVETIEKAVGDGAVRVFAKERNEAYEVNDIAFGLIQRAETNIVLDKEISNIKLTTNDNRVIFDAKYNIDYKVVSASERSLDQYVVIAQVGKGIFRDKYLVADITLSEIDSIGIDVMQAINKQETKLTTDGFSGIQNFRYINVDDTILQGTTIQIDYKLTALNVGEVDTTSETIANIADEITPEHKLISKESKIRDLAVEVANNAKTFSSNPQDVKVLDLGKYIGRAYYNGNMSEDKVVATRVRQVVDYIDTDGAFTANYNNTENHSWKNTTINELLGNGYESDRLIKTSLLSERDSVDKNGIQYITENRNNIVLSIDNYEQIDKLNNSGFEQTLYPYAAAEGNDEINYKSAIDLTVTKTVSATDDADNLSYDNIAEIVKYENISGRRDEATIPGNANPEEEQFTESLKERDQSATELVTFTPPTGLEVDKGMTLQVLFISGIALVILAVGVVVIKKTVLK